MVACFALKNVPNSTANETSSAVMRLENTKSAHSCLSTVFRADIQLSSAIMDKAARRFSWRDICCKS